jgi:outer membrane protein OmpA-like peptidoglycan-associated protein
MKQIKKISLIVFAAIIFIPQIKINAQETQLDTTNFWRNSWYIEAGGGIQTLFSSDVKDLSAAQRITPDISLSAGKWFNPFWGIRLQASGYSLNGNTSPLTNSTFADGYDVSSNVTVRPDGSYRHYLRYLNAHVDVRLSMFNLCGGAKFHHWDIIQSLGVGYMRTFAYKGTPATNNVSMHFAVMGKYSINEHWDINLEVAAAAFPNSFDGRTTQTALEGKLGGTLGVTYNFNNKPSKCADKYFAKKAEPKEPSLNEKQKINKQLSDINSRLENIDSRLENVESNVAKLEPVIEVKTVVDTVLLKREPFVLASIRFNYGKSEPIKGQEINYVNIADYLKANPYAKIILSGYGDKINGTPEGNLQISQQRINSIRNILIEKYGINFNRIETQAIGADNQPYQINEWNRVVVVTVVE